MTDPTRLFDAADRESLAELHAYLTGRPQPNPNTGSVAALRRVRAVLETEHVVGRTALEYRGLIVSALMAEETASADRAAAPGQADSETLLELVRDFLDPDPCSFDHHGYCQAHAAGFGGEPMSCPHSRARKLLAELDAPAVQAPATNRAGLRDRIAAALYERERPPRDPHWPDVYASDREVFEAMADAVLPELPGPTDRAAVLNQAADFFRGLHATGTVITAQEVEAELRRMAAEPAVPGQAHSCRNCEGIDPDTCLMNPHRPPEHCPAAEFEDYGQQCQKPVGHELHSFEERPKVVHGCPPEGSGLTPCCGRTLFELPLTDRISSEAPVTCPGPEQPAAGAQQDGVNQ